MSKSSHPERKGAGVLMVRAAFLRNAAFIISAGLSFLLVPLIIGALGDRWYGVWVVVGTFMGYYGLLDFGIASATQRFLALEYAKDQQQDAQEIIGTSFLMFAAIGVAALLISGGLIFAAPLLVADEADVALIRKVLAVMAIDIALSFPMSVFHTVLSSRMRIDLIALINIVKSVVRFCGIFYVTRTTGTIIDLAIVTIMVNQAANLAVMELARWQMPGRGLTLRRFSMERVRSLLSFGKFTFLAAIGDLLRFRIDVLVIGYFLGAALVTPYNIALRLHEVAGQVVANVVSGFQPLFVNHYAKGDVAAVRERMLTVTRIGLTLSTLISGGVILIAEPLIDIWVGHEYLAALFPLFILRVISPLGVGQSPGIQVLYAYGRHKYYAYLTVVEAVLNVIISIALVSSMGIIGVALGTAIPFVIAKLFVLPPIICGTVNLDISRYYRILLGYISLCALIQLPLLYGLVILEWRDSIWLALPSVAIYEGIAGFAVLFLIIPNHDYAAIRKVLRHLPERPAWR